ncbi:hypothetical protein [Vibrio agarivorans]|uniref:hypothetical protein n=1 Tax=Vibrio agarivorans TaxID=153622 RepID=UPI002230E719|nr:hypothetical protein [Vibrio agarivorans]
MISIRYKHNYRLITLTPSGVVGKSAVTGNSIPALLKSGERHYAPYLGSIDAGLCVNRMRVKLLGIVAWSPDPDGVGGAWYDILKDSYVVGVYQNGGYYVATQNESPVHHVSS